MRVIMKTRPRRKLMRVGAPAVAALVLLSLLTLSPTGTGAASNVGQSSRLVSADWPLTPAGLRAGDSFRLLFVSSTTHSAMSVSEQDYIGVIKGRADANAVLKPYKDDFSALVSTQYHDARDLTGTTGAGVPIYWVGGEKVADDYGDFYDASWDSHAARDESGALMTSLGTRHIWTGSASNGTKKANHFLGAGHAAIGKLAGENGGTGKEIDRSNSATSSMQHLYGMSPVFTVAGHQVAANSPLVPEGLRAGDGFRLLFVTSSTRNSEPTDIDEYNQFVEGAANQNPALAPYEFRVVGSTEDVGARVNTGTTGDGGVPIYWVGGEKVADDYGDFYDGTWDSLAAKNQQGEDNTPGVIATGSNNNGTRTHRFLGQGEWTTYGNLSEGNVLRSTNNIVAWHSPVHYYGLSPLFTVSAPTATTAAPTPTTTAVPTTTTPSGPLPAVTLRARPYSISEDGGVSTIRASLDQPASEAITITISAVESVSGEVKADLYTLSANRTLSIAAGATHSTGTVTVSAVDNTRKGRLCCWWEDDVVVIVSGTVTGTARPVTDAWVTIKDDDQIGGL